MPRPGPKKTPNRVVLDISTARGEEFRALLRTWSRRFLLRLEQQGAELSVSLVGDAAIRKLNRQWRKKDKATDVLSFPAGDMPPGMPGPRLLGDVVISLDTARRVAREDQREISDELKRYLAHGLLHLLGYDHERSAREAARMAALEESLLGGRGLIPPARSPPKP